MHKINRFSVFLILVIALFLQVGPLNYIKISGAKPDLLLVSVVFFALFFGEGVGLGAGMAAGMMADIFALDFFFINTFILGLTGLVVGALNTKFFKESRATQFTLVLVFTLFAASLHYLIVSAFSKSISFSFAGYLFRSALVCAVYTSLVSLFIFSRLIRIFELRGREDYI